MEVILISGLAILATLVSTLIQKRLIDVDLVKSIKADIKKLQQEMKKHRQDPKKTSELMKKSFGLQKKMLSLTMKPNMISSVTIFFSFLLLGYFFGLPPFFGTVKLYFSLPFSLPLIGSKLAWFWLFILVSIIFSFIFRKIFDLGY